MNDDDFTAGGVVGFILGALFIVVFVWFAQAGTIPTKYTQFDDGSARVCYGKETLAVRDTEGTWSNPTGLEINFCK